MRPNQFRFVASAPSTGRLLFSRGIDAFRDRLERQKTLYAELCAYADGAPDTGRFVSISDGTLFRRVLRTFGPALTRDIEAGARLYDAAFDRELGALLIANRGATLWCLSPFTRSPYLARHIGAAVYLPGMGIEMLNVGLVGDVYSGAVALRSESACTPSFVFGSQRCNCCHQWDSFRELAASFNPAEAPKLRKDEFERWVQAQARVEGGRHLFATHGPGFVLLHLDTQNGMGSGATPGEFSADLFSRASLRHRGEYSAEQVLGTSMAGGFRAVGLEPDPRSGEGNLGYRLTPLVLDYLGVSKELIVLSNNRRKLAELRRCGYRVRRVKSLGAVNEAGALEAEQRGTEFGHLDIDASCVTFEDEFTRVRAELAARFAKNAVALS